MTFLLIVPISATEYDNGAVYPMYESNRKSESTLSISQTTANCFSTAYSNNVIKITAVQTLEKYWGLWIWTTVDGSLQTKTVNNNMITLSNTVHGLSSGKYRVKTIFTFTDNKGQEEKVTVYSNQKTI